MQTLVSVALGGALGALLRYGTTLGVARLVGVGFPMGTMVVNVVGSFLMGCIAVYVMHRVSHPWVYPFLMVGVLGGFTTFSAFSMDAFALLEKGRLIAAGGYIFGSVGLSIVALMCGVLIARALSA